MRGEGAVWSFGHSLVIRRLFRNPVAAEDHDSQSERLLMGYEFVAGLGSQTRLKLQENMEPPHQSSHQVLRPGKRRLLQTF
jgi:hypothetical protein